MRRQAENRTRPGRGAHRELWSSPICAPFPEFRARHGTHVPGVPASQRGLGRGLQRSRRVPTGPCKLAPALPVSSLGSQNFAIDNAEFGGVWIPARPQPPHRRLLLKSLTLTVKCTCKGKRRPRIPKFRVDRQVAKDQGGGREIREGKRRRGL